MADITQETQQFTLHKNMIHHLIDSQAGSLSKGVAEAVMNSIDAGATEINVTMSEKNMVIEDNGKGFETKDEILKCFSVFGFEHDDRQRELGRFGLGRGQLWSYASTLWKTHQFELDVDIRYKGIEYILREGLPYVDGLVIQAQFYEPLNILDIGAVERELQELVLYSKILVTFNGKTINRDIRRERWFDSIDEAYIRLTDTGGLKIYNLGIFVCELPSYKFGFGGVIVTKPGHAFMLNMARNSIIESKCPLWKTVKPKLEKISGIERETRTYLTPGQKQHVLHRWYSEGPNTPNFYDLIEQKLFQCVDKRWHSLSDIFLRRRILKISYSEIGSSFASRLNEAEDTFILNKDMLDEVNAENIASYFERFYKFNSKYANISKHNFGNKYFDGEDRSTFKTCHDRIQFFDDYKLINPSLNLEHRKAKPSELTDFHIVTLNALRDANHYIYRAVSETTGHSIYGCTLNIGISETCLGWTNCSSDIWINKTVIEKAALGVSGCMSIMSLLVHEYLHTEPDTSAHTHSPEFFEKFEAVMMDRHGLIGQAIDEFLRSLAPRMRASTKRMKTGNVVKSVSLMQNTIRDLELHVREMKLVVAEMAQSNEANLLKN